MQKSLRVGLLIYGPLETVSGGYLYDRKLVERLRSAGDTVEVISIPWRSYPLHLADNLSGTLLQRLGELRVDVLLQDELSHPSLFWLNRRLRSSARYPVVSIVHHLRSREIHPPGLRLLYRSVEQLYLASVDGYIFNSRTTRHTVESLVGPMKPCVVARPAGDRFHQEVCEREVIEKAARPGPLQLLFAGNIIPRKGLHILFDALELALPVSDCTLVVAGSLSAAPRYARVQRERACKHPLQGRVRFTGPVSDEELAAEMAEAHILVVPSFYEGYGIIYLEGMSFGLPAVGTTGGAAGEIIEDGKSGFLVPPGDARILAECIAHLAADRKKLAENSLNALARYHAHPTWQESMGQARNFLRALPGQWDANEG
jgi:glycosyltransferase involved in cell wall biosynthesis